MSTAKRLTPNKIANLVMADEAWHDSEYVAASDYDALSAELAALRAERDAERWRERAEQLARMSDGETAERYWAKVDALVERNRGSMPERAAIDAAMRAEG